MCSWFLFMIANVYEYLIGQIETKIAEDDDDDFEDDMPPRKRSRSVSGGQLESAQSDAADIVDIGGAGGELIDNDELTWRPLFSQSYWQDENMTDRVSVAICLPSGCGGKGDATVAIDDDGCSLVLTVSWPLMLSDVKKLHAKWLNGKNCEKIPPFHPKFNGFNKFYSQLRKTCSERLSSTARIPLQFQVQQRIEGISRIGDSNGARIIYVELKAFESAYVNDANEVDSFEVFN